MKTSTKMISILAACLAASVTSAQLAELTKAKDVASLQEFLKSKYLADKIDASRALRQIGNPSATPALVSCLKENQFDYIGGTEVELDQAELNNILVSTISGFTGVPKPEQLDKASIKSFIATVEQKIDVTKTSSQAPTSAPQATEEPPSTSTIAHTTNTQYLTPEKSPTNVTPAINSDDAFKRIVTVNVYDPKNPPPAQTNTPAGTYYKRFGSNLVLGHWDGTNTFTPLDPPQTIDVSKSSPISLPYGELRTPDDLKKDGPKKRYTDSEGRIWEEWYDAATQTMKARVVPNP